MKYARVPVGSSAMLSGKKLGPVVTLAKAIPESPPPSSFAVQTAVALLLVSVIVHATTPPAIVRTAFVASDRAASVLTVPPAMGTSRMPSLGSTQATYLPSVTIWERNALAPRQFKRQFPDVLATVHRWQVPALQVPPMQSWPQLPQFFASVCKFTHDVAQCV